MDSRGERADGARGDLDSSLPKRSSAFASGSNCKRLLYVLAWLLVLYVTVAQATSYVYDANGRLVAVTQDNGASAQYSYDALGNLLQITSVPAGQLTLFSFSPTHGTVGTPVTLYGQGFGSTPASNAVSFNGTAATVTAATTTQLQVQVPDGASTGPITVTTGGQSVSSSAPFTVDDTGLPPVITQVSPATVAVGDTVTVAGAHLLPISNATDIRLGGYPVVASAISNTQLQFVVPGTAGSGHVSVLTPYGQALSAETVVVLPAGLNAANVVSRGYATVDSAPVNLTIGAAGQVGAVLFDTTGGNWLSLQASAIATSATNINYKVYAPGNVLVQQGTISAASPSIHLPRLGKRGTYLATFQPDTAGAQLSVAVETNAALAADKLTVVATNVPGQSKRVLFNAMAGQTLAFYIAGATSTPANQAVGYTVYSPNGSSYTSATTSNSGTINLPNLPTTGTYQVVMGAGSGATTTTQIEIVSGVTGQVPPDGTSQVFSANAPGQNVYFNFTAQQGASYELALAGVTVTGATNSYYDLYVYNASGGQVAYSSCNTNNPAGNCNLQLWYLPAGQYSVTVVPVYGGTLHFNALLTPPLIGPNLAPNSTTSIALGTGQWERLTFNANAGDTIALQVSGVTTTPAGQPVRFAVYRPDAGAITTSTPTYTALEPSGSQLLNLPNLPVSGTYTVIVYPYYALPATAQLSVVSGATGQVPSDGTPQTFNANAPGQNVYFNFNAQQGDYLELTLTNASLTGASGTGYEVYVNNVAGGQVSYSFCYTNNPAGNCNLQLWYLPAGKYSVTVVPTNGGTLHFNALIQPHIVGPKLALNSSVNINLGTGQAERLTFDANAGDTIALQVSGVSTTPVGQPVRFSVYRPDAGSITTATPAYTVLAPSGSQLLNLPNLPVSGTYTVIVNPYYAIPATAQLSVVSGATGQVPSDGTLHAFNANAPGQYVYFNFTAQQGDYLELTLTNASLTGVSNTGYQVYVSNAAGAQVLSSWCYTDSPAGNCNVHLWYMPAGKYSVTVVPVYGGTLHFNAMLQPQVLGPKLALNGTANIALGTGQIERVTFDANAGDTIALQVSGVTTTPAGQPVQFTVYRPDAGSITTATPAYTVLAPSGSQLLNLPNLPVSGTYTVIVNPYYAIPATAQLSVVSGATGQVPSDGTLHAFNANAPGQYVYFNFTAQQGDYLELTLTNASLTGVSNTGYQVYVSNAAGAQVLSSWCYTDSPAGNCNVHLWYMPAGKYSVTVVPVYGGTLHFNAMLQPVVAGPVLTANGMVNIALNTGQVERLTFSANARDTLTLRLSGPGTTPAGQPVYVNVYRPDAGAITTGTPAYAGFSTADTSAVALSNLPVSGTYTVLVIPAYGLPMSAQLSATQGTPGGPPTYGTPTQPTDGSLRTYAATAAGQNVTLSFNANLGDNLELTFSDVSVTGGGYFRAIVYNASGGQVSSAYCYNVTGPSCRQALWNLPAGTYSVILYPDGNGTISTKAMVQPDVVGPTMTPNVPASIGLGAGQLQRLTFSANAGDTVALQLSGVSTTPAGQSVYVNVYRPDTGAITVYNSYTNFDATGSNVINLPNLPASGTYTVAVYTAGGIPASAQLTVFNGVTGTVPTGSNAQTFNASAAGQNVYLAFDANQGDNLELTFSDVSVSGGSYFRALVYNAAGAQVSSAYCYNVTGPSCRQALWNLPAGTYSVILYPDGNGTISTKAMVQPDVVGPTMTPNVPASIGLGAGQLQRLTFSANAGDTVALQLSGVSTTPAGQSVYVNVYRPDTGAITVYNSYTNFDATGSNVINLPNLPASGTYTVAVYTAGGIPASAQLTVFNGVTGTVPTGSNAQTFNASAAGQNVYLAFDANQGDNLELSFSDVSVAGASDFRALVYNPSGAQVGSVYCYSATGPSCRLAVWNLPQGTYSVVLYPDGNGIISTKAMIQPDLYGPPMALNTTTPISLDSGQLRRLTFNGSVGDTVTLQLSGVSTTPAGQSVYAAIYRPDTGAITVSNYYTYFTSSGSAQLSLPNLPASGTYTVAVYTANGVPANVQLGLTRP